MAIAGVYWLYPHLLRKKNIFVGQMPNVHRKNVALLGGWIPNVSWKKTLP